jgi:hypothetical protein
MLKAIHYLQYVHTGNNIPHAQQHVQSLEHLDQPLVGSAGLQQQLLVIVLVHMSLYASQGQPPALYSVQ